MSKSSSQINSKQGIQEQAMGAHTFDLPQIVDTDNSMPESDTMSVALAESILENLAASFPPPEEVDNDPVAASRSEILVQLHCRKSMLDIELSSNKYRQ